MENDRTKPVRLQKYLADAGVCSRRAAEALIADGEVVVNGKPAQIGDKVIPGADEVIVSGTRIRPPRVPRKITVAVNKPRGLICSNRDPHHDKTIFDLLPPQLARLRLFCAGRLDKESEGLVILTTDGDLANRLMHPSGLVVKFYRVSLKTPFPRTALPKLTRGITIDGERLKVERARLITHGNKDQASTEIDVQMHHGKKREIRQLFTALGYDVKRLRRYRIGNFSLRGFPVRSVRILTDSEIASLLALPQP
ncbi:MAG: rRNA pseudouridine synthase [Verrucomicrobia bacterium]|nr:MAG: rRNA pseudouridine synthase [Verrucomicrobiota bacterium]